MKHLYAFTFLALVTFQSFATKHIINAGWTGYTNNVFVPNQLNVTVGDTIRWEWVAGVHTTTSLTIPGGAVVWDNPVDAANLFYEYQVTVAGTYDYECTIHTPAMHGVFTAYTTLPAPVTKHVIKAGFPPYTNNQFVPNLLNGVCAGDTIRWEWVAGVHTTTSLTIPGGAAVWDNPLDVSNLSYEYIVTAAGAYDYECTIHTPSMHGIFNASGCTVGINDVENLVDISVFPNPTNDKFQVSGLKFQVGEIQIYNVWGETVFQSSIQQLSDSEIDFSNQPAGIYFLRLNTTEGMVNNKIVVQK